MDNDFLERQIPPLRSRKSPLPKSIQILWQLIESYPPELITSDTKQQTKLIYKHIMQNNFQSPRITEQFPNQRWHKIWHNIHLANIRTAWQTTVYCYINHIIPTEEGKHRHHFTLLLVDPPNENAVFVKVWLAAGFLHYQLTASVHTMEEFLKMLATERHKFEQSFPWNSKKRGYSDLNNLHTAISTHEKSDSHIHALITLGTFGKNRTYLLTYLLTYLQMAFKEPEGSLPPSHKPASGPYPVQD
ncbi:hypothetical protein ANN_19251 [Periplaneta americana]|uniref:Uncharacterized protein n=1 Tax=Periplaneta americana TaxID=6978 RepID=A0ABQ8S9C5_PERAM|nr:hypothetical protein ANN_19251 [Periplaneta americana]